MRIWFVALIFAATLIANSTQKKDDSDSQSLETSSESVENIERKKFDALTVLKQFVDKLQSLQFKETGDSNKTYAYLWDLLPSPVRLLILNQVEVKKNLPSTFNSYEWSQLPDIVKTTLVNQKDKDLFLNLTLADWGLVDKSNRLASISFYTLIKDTHKPIVKNITEILKPLNFDLKIDKEALNAYLNPISKLNKLKPLFLSKNYEKLWKPLHKLGRSFVSLKNLTKEDKVELKTIGLLTLLKFKMKGN